MNYDKVSFLSGVAVGQTLRGWGVERRSSGGAAAASLTVGAEVPCVLDAGLALPADALVAAVAALGWLSTAEVNVDLGLLAAYGALGDPERPALVPAAETPLGVLAVPGALPGAAPEIHAETEESEHE